MKILLITTLFILSATFAVSAQNVPCPPDKPDAMGCLIITHTAAVKALTDSDQVKAQTAEIAAKDKAISDLKDELNKIKIEFAGKTEGLSQCQQNAVSDRAIIQLLVQGYPKRSKYGVIVF